MTDVAATSNIAPTEQAARVWLDGLEIRLEELAVAYNEAAFQQYRGAASSQLSTLDTQIGAIMAEPANRHNLSYWQPLAQNSDLRRRLENLSRIFLEAQVSKNPAIFGLRNRINERLLQFQPVVNGQYWKRADLLQALRTDPARATRRTLFEQGLAPLAAELAPRVQELLLQRNRAAQGLGYADFAHLHLTQGGLDYDELLATFAKLEEITRPVYQSFLAEQARMQGWKRVEAWDIGWLAEQQAVLPGASFRRQDLVPQALQMLDWLGLDIENLPIKVFEQEIPFGGLCFSIKIPGDIRILVNPRDGYSFFRTILHEFGHALHSSRIEQNYYSLKYEPGVFNEGMAETLAFLSHYPEWLANFLTPAQVKIYISQNRIKRLIRWRTLTAQAHFELLAYQNPYQDLERLNAELEAHYLLTPLNLTPRWAASSFPTTHPLYRHNYIWGEMIAAQTHAVLSNPFELDKAGRLDWFGQLHEIYYKPGSRTPWPDKIRQLTGTPLGLDALLAEAGF